MNQRRRRRSHVRTGVELGRSEVTIGVRITRIPDTISITVLLGRVPSVKAVVVDIADAVRVAIYPHCGVPGVASERQRHILRAALTWVAGIADPVIVEVCLQYVVRERAVVVPVAKAVAIGIEDSPPTRDGVAGIPKTIAVGV